MENKRKKSLLKWLTFFLLLSIINACTEEKSNKLVFKYNQINPITSLDPAFAKSQNNIWACHHIYNTLLRFDDSLRVVNDLAKSYSISDDGLAYTFILNTNVVFHEDPCFGELKQRTLVAEDVVYSLKRLTDPSIQSPGSWLLKDKVKEGGLKALNDSTVLIKLNQRFAPFLSLLANKYCSIIPHEAVDYYQKDFRKNPVGTGPMKLKKWLENEAMFLTKNEQYFRETVHVDAVKVSFMTDRKMAYLELLNGNLDLVSGIESSFLHKLLNADGSLQDENKSIINFVKSPFLNTEYIGINCHSENANPWLSNKQFRQALNYAVDKSLMLEVLRNNIGKHATEGFIPAGLPPHKEEAKGYVYSLPKAKALLETINFPAYDQQKGLVINTNADYLDLVTFVAKQWENAGIKVRIEVFESALLREGMRSGKLDLFRASWIADYPDAENFLCLFYGPNPAPPNYTRFDNANIDLLYNQAVTETDPIKRMNLYREMEAIIIEEAPMVFLFYDQSSLFTSKRVKKIHTNALNLLEIEGLQLNLN